MKVVKKRKKASLWSRIFLVVLFSLVLVSILGFSLKSVIGKILNRNIYYDDIISETISENIPSQVYIEYPVTGNESVNQMINKYINDGYSQFKNEASRNASLEHEYHVSYDAIPYNRSIVSFLFTEYKISSTMAHGIQEVNAFTFDMETGNLVQLKDLFDDESSYNLFKSSLKEQIKDVMDFDTQEEPYLTDQEIDEVIENTKNFSITAKTLSIYYEPYEIAPGYMSTQTIEIKLDSIQGLKTEQLDMVNPEVKLGSNALYVYDELKQKELIKQYKNKKIVALTFDDGPHRVLTTELLSVLKEKHVQATFFVLGSRVENNPEIVNQAALAGHSIGSHAYSHHNLLNLPENQLIEEIKKTQELIQNATGLKPNLLRPPYGAFNEAVLKHADAAIIMWSIDTEDWKYRNTNVIKQNIIDHVKDGSIILMHDIYQTSIDAVPDVIDSLTDLGYTFVTVDTLLQARQGMGNSKVYFYGAQ